MIIVKVKETFCPKCGEDITDSYLPFDFGIKGGNEWGGWWCEECEFPVVEEEEL